EPLGAPLHRSRPPATPPTPPPHPPRGGGVSVGVPREGLMEFGPGQPASVKRGSAAGIGTSGSFSSRRTRLAPRLVATHLKKAIRRASPSRPKPQSVDRMSRSGGTYSSARRISVATTSGGSTAALVWLTTPTAIFLSVRYLPRSGRSRPPVEAHSSV